MGGYERRNQAKAKSRSEQLPAHLPRYEVELDVTEDQKTCGERQVIGYDWQETLEVVPPKLIVRRTGIPKLACDLEVLPYFRVQISVSIVLTRIDLVDTCPTLRAWNTNTTRSTTTASLRTART